MRTGRNGVVGGGGAGVVPPVLVEGGGAAGAVPPLLVEGGGGILVTSRGGAEAAGAPGAAAVDAPAASIVIRTEPKLVSGGTTMMTSGLPLCWLRMTMS